MTQGINSNLISTLGQQVGQGLEKVRNNPLVQNISGKAKNLAEKAKSEINSVLNPQNAQSHDEKKAEAGGEQTVNLADVWEKGKSAFNNLRKRTSDDTNQNDITNGSAIPTKKRKIISDEDDVANVKHPENMSPEAKQIHEQLAQQQKMDAETLGIFKEANQQINAHVNNIQSVLEEIRSKRKQGLAAATQGAQPQQQPQQPYQQPYQQQYPQQYQQPPQDPNQGWTF